MSPSARTDGAPPTVTMTFGDPASEILSNAPTWKSRLPALAARRFSLASPVEQAPSSSTGIRIAPRMSVSLVAVLYI